MKKTLLTIAIPTYNRHYTLEHLLTQLLSEDLTSTVILVADDASPDSDKTKKLLKRISKKTNKLKYYSNVSNLGYSLNVKKLYEKSNSEYIWYLCDDDEIIPGSVKKIKKNIITLRPTVAVFNCSWTNSFGVKKIAGPTQNNIYVDRKKFVDYQPLMRTIFLSIGVYKKQAEVLNLADSVVKDNIFIQLTLAIALLDKDFNLCECCDLVVNRKVGFKYGEFIKFNLIDHFKAITAIGHKFEMSKFISWSKARFPSFIILYVSQKIGIFLYNGKPSNTTLKHFIRYYGISRFLIYSLVVLVTNIIPSFIIKILYFIALLTMHNVKDSISIYTSYVDRAIKDTRKTLFTNYN